MHTHVGGIITCHGSVVWCCTCNVWEYMCIGGVNHGGHTHVVVAIVLLMHICIRCVYANVCRCALRVYLHMHVIQLFVCMIVWIHIHTHHQCSLAYASRVCSMVLAWWCTCVCDTRPFGHTQTRTPHRVCTKLYVYTVNIYTTPVWTMCWHS